jgi:serine/threonine kinase PknH
MPLFISYSSQDRPSLEELTKALKRAQQQVWFDQELGGGDAWWNAILEQIRSCEVFIVALSNNWLQSKPSQAELRYARALNRPILPVRVGPVDSVRVNPVSDLQIIDYQNPTIDAGIALVTAIHALRAKDAPLPSPLPDEPPVPFGYITRMGNTLAEKELSPQQQLQLLVELRSGLDEDGEDPSARSDIAQLLRMLRLRHDVTYRTRSEIDNVLAEIGAADGDTKGATPDPKPAAAPAAPAQPAPQQHAAARPPAAKPSAAPAATVADGQSRKRLVILGGGALAVVVAIVVVVMLATQGPRGKPAPKPTAAPTSAPVTAGRVDAVLLSAQDIGKILGDQNMVSAGHGDQLRPQQGTLSKPECLGAFEPLQESVYRAFSPTAMRSDILHTAGDDPAHRVLEAVASFESAEKARAFVEASAEKWRTCADQNVTFTASAGKTVEWSVGNVTGAAPMITQIRTQTDGSNRACQHVLSAVADVVIDVQACGVDINDGAGRMAEQMATRANS